MNAEGWNRVDELFQNAVEIQPSDRRAYLDKECRGDEFLRNEVESLLSSDSCDWEFIDRSALESAAVLLADEQQKVGHYEILKLIGRGGMGEVYLARDQILNRDIALKLLPQEYTQDPDRLSRFQREARTISALNHPNIITIYELGNVEDQEFISTELIEGETLRTRLKMGAMLIRDALEIALQIAGALAAAHRSGIVHRDIKPENIMLRPDGYIKVLDFGLAKLAEQSESFLQSTNAEGLDMSSGLLMGTARYMSPEQAKGISVDSRSDIFSLGTVLYEMLTGRPPFDEEHTATLTESILHEDPLSIDKLATAVPANLVFLVDKMLSKDRKSRYQNADELIKDLKFLQKELVADASHLESRRPESMLGSMLERIARWPGLAFSLIIIAVVLAIGYSSFKFLRGEAAEASTERLLAEAGTWTTKSPISSPRWQAEPAVLNNVLYVAGGWNVCSPFANLESYDSATDTWTQKASMIRARGGHGVAVLNGQIYAVGGSIDCAVHISSVEAYDPATDSWSEKAPLPSARAAHVVAVSNGRSEDRQVDRACADANPAIGSCRRGSRRNYLCDGRRRSVRRVVHG
ncbi:MAG: hypothetical protein DMF63_15475 [Acidobacteria bacterium]|nr:MAG: hypothetical protein DMF63_15475 [Acidobacteriota bacterium]